MIIRSFNYWFLVVTLVPAIAFLGAFCSVGKKVVKKKKRVVKRMPDHIWRGALVAYVLFFGVVFYNMLVAESMLGMIELLYYISGTRFVGASKFARIIFVCATVAWMAVFGLVADFVRVCRINSLNSLNKPWKRHAPRLYDFSEQKATTPTTATPAAAVPATAAAATQTTTAVPVEAATVASVEKEDTDSQSSDRAVIEHYVGVVFKKFRIEKRDDLDHAYSDDGHLVSEYLPEDAEEYFVAIYMEDDCAVPLFLGAGTEETAAENLRRYLQERVKMQICPQRAAI